MGVARWERGRGMSAGWREEAAIRREGGVTEGAVCRWWYRSERRDGLGRGKRAGGRGVLKRCREESSDGARGVPKRCKDDSSDGERPAKVVVRGMCRTRKASARCGSLRRRSPRCGTPLKAAQRKGDEGRSAWRGG